MGFPILVRWHLYIESGPWRQFPMASFPRPHWRCHGCAANSLQWRHNGHYGVSNHQPDDCLFSRLFRRRSEKTSKLHVTGFVRGIHRWPVNSRHKEPMTRKMFPFDDFIMRGLTDDAMGVLQTSLLQKVRGRVKISDKVPMQLDVCFYSTQETNQLLSSHETERLVTCGRLRSSFLGCLLSHPREWSRTWPKMLRSQWCLAQIGHFWGLRGVFYVWVTFRRNGLKICNLFYHQSTIWVQIEYFQISIVLREVNTMDFQYNTHHAS